MERAGKAELMSERWTLIVEDDAELGIAFAEVLDLSGMRAELVQNGRLALAALAHARPDLVLLDLHLPEVSGPEILDYIRNNEHLKTTHVVIVSADAVRAEQLKEKVDLVLVKPISFTEIFSLAERFFSISV